MNTQTKPGISERTRMIAAQALFQRRVLVDEDAKRYRQYAKTPSPTWNRLQSNAAEALEHELQLIDQAIEELRTW